MLQLVPPSIDTLAAYRAALERGWSPNTTRDVSAEQLARIEVDPAGFVAEMADEAGGGTIDLGGGRMATRLPGPTRWIWDGSLCGSINLRFQPGTVELPPHVSGHVGYAVVPWKRRRGIATAALGMMLELARERGLARVSITCDLDNEASRRVILANGGVRAADLPPEDMHGPRCHFWIDLT
jgi:predicted acetyltransferase